MWEIKKNRYYKTWGQGYSAISANNSWKTEMRKNQINAGWKEFTVKDSAWND
jgi:hypothetical protein